MVTCASAYISLEKPSELTWKASYNLYGHLFNEIQITELPTVWLSSLPFDYSRG